MYIFKLKTLFIVTHPLEESISKADFTCRWLKPYGAWWFPLIRDNKQNVFFRFHQKHITLPTFSKTTPFSNWYTLRTTVVEAGNLLWKTFLQSRSLIDYTQGRPTAFLIWTFLWSANRTPGDADVFRQKMTKLCQVMEKSDLLFEIWRNPTQNNEKWAAFDLCQFFGV